MVEEIVGCMKLHGKNSNVQRIQTEHRVKIAEFWGIKEGSRVLEIGCGQGDTIAVLAYLVGESGFVYGVDVASPSYGSPITLGEAAQHIKQSKLGKQLRIDFETDLLNPKLDFPEKSFDFIVLSHCSWYFESPQKLLDILTKVRKWGKHLCFAEWDLRIQQMEQYPHLMAVLIQAQYECFKESSESNVRTLFTADDVKKMAEQADWKMCKDTTIYSPDLQDGVWEVNYTIDEYEAELKDNGNLSDKLKALIESEVFLLKTAAANGKIKPMSTYAFIAQ